MTTKGLGIGVRKETGSKYNLGIDAPIRLADGTIVGANPERVTKLQEELGIDPALVKEETFDHIEIGFLRRTVAKVLGKK